MSPSPQGPTSRSPRILGAGVALLAAAGAAVGSAPAGASTIVYQCGPGVCAVDPDTSDAPRTLVADGRTAGVTADGRSAAWVAGGSLVTRAIAAGGTDATIFTGEIYDLPRISPDGTRALWSWYFGGYGWYTYRTVPGSTGTSGYPPTIDSSTSATTHGWMGPAAIVVHRGSGTVAARIYRAEPDGTSCATDVATEPDVNTKIAYPDGRDDGSAVVAVRGPADGGFGVPTTGRIAVYANGTFSHDVTSGPADTLPTWSAEGDRIAFQRDGGIWVVDAAGGTPRRVAEGDNPSWGGARTVAAPAPGAPGTGGGGTGGGGTGGGGGGSAGGGTSGGSTTPAVRVASTSLRYRGGRIAVRLRCTTTSTCRGTVRIVRGRTTLGSRRYVVSRGRTATVSVRPGARARRVLRSARRHRVTVRTTPAGGKAVSRSMTLRRP